MPLDNEKKDIIYLLKKYRNNTCSEEELRLLYHYYNVSAGQQPLLPLVPEETRKIEAVIWQEIGEKCDFNQPVRTIPPYRRKTYIAVAAACIALLVSVTALLFHHLKPSAVATLAVTEEIQPGQTGATLILGDGKQIQIDDSTFTDEAIVDAHMLIFRDELGALKYKQTDDPNDVAKIRYNSLATSRGQTISITLSDNSKVWLNADSRISYPADMSQHGSREIRLTGEAFFEVEKDELRPFIVHSELGTIEVKGTAFNVNAYPGTGKVVATVTEGRVQVSNRNNQSVLITPNQQAVMSRHTIQKSEYVDTELFSSWKDGYFTFQGNIEELLAAIAKWYNVDVAPVKTSRHLIFYGKISRNQPLEQVLNILSGATGLQFKIENRTIITD